MVSFSIMIQTNKYLYLSIHFYVIQLVKSTCGRKPDQIKTAHALGLNKISSYVILDSNPAILGMVRKIKRIHAVEVLSSGTAGCQVS